ncbi:hypothetical protein [Nocardia shimofusensis]|uniref:hypothetical protein n=1 Tax=Nocardia shimofusensis TaxID=228596 RepID=UPI00083251D9|nr:hypothetical protein [Nocardia shimofusensis]
MSANRRASAKVLALRAIPILGWLYLAVGAVAAWRGRAPRHRLLRAAWWIDAFLSLVVHAAQIPVALRAAEGSGRSALRTAVLTQIFGLTWWRTNGKGQA